MKRSMYVIANGDGQFWRGFGVVFDDDLSRAARFERLDAATWALTSLAVLSHREGRRIDMHLERWGAKAEPKGSAAPKEEP